jgi:hypothetical protein
MPDNNNIASLIEALGNVDSHARQRAIVTLEAQGKAVLRPLVDALESTNLMRRTEAARLLARLAQRIADAATDASSLAPEPLPQSIPGLVGALRHPNIPYREKVEAALSRHGNDAISALIQALPTASPIHASRIANILVRLQGVEAIPALVARIGQSAETRSEEALIKALDDLTLLLPMRWRTLSIETLLGLLINSRIRSERLDDSVALTLVRIAQEAPSPLLRQALPYLKRPWHQRLPSFNAARKAIEEATKTWKDLPVPASVSTDSTNLPQPVPGGGEPSE